MAKVYIGVGHGGTDPGAVGNGFEEEDLTLSVALACKTHLDSKGVTTKISRTSDVNFDTNAKVKDANAWGADLVLDIHINAGGGVGSEVYHAISGGTSKVLAQNILDSMVADCKTKSRGIKTKQGTNGDYFGIIRDTKAPAVLVECCFIDSVDVQKIDTGAEQTAFGQAIAKGVLKTLGGPVITSAPAQPKFRLIIATGTRGECETILNWVREKAPYAGVIEEVK